MHKILVLTQKELWGFFDSLTAYVMLVVFLGLSGFFTWMFGSTIFFINQASLNVFFSVSFWSIFFFVPAITMRSFAEEQRTGTLELLLTKAISNWQIVLGKFFACWLLILIALFCTLPYYFTISALGNVDHGAIWGGYVGLALLAATYISLGIFSSSLTNNQIFSFLLALFIGVMFHVLFDIIGSTSSSLSSVFMFLSTREHFSSVSRGVFDSRDLLYFLSLTIFWLFLAKIKLDTKRT